MGSLVLAVVTSVAVLVCPGKTFRVGGVQNGTEPHQADTSLSRDSEESWTGSARDSPSSRPWQMALFYRGHFRCGATLVDENWVATAAHCVARISRLYLWVVGVTSLEQGRRLPYRSGRYVRQVFLHPRFFSSVFRRDVPAYDSDLALLLLSCPPRSEDEGPGFASRVQSICPPQHSPHDLANSPIPHQFSSPLHLYAWSQYEQDSSRSGISRELMADVIDRNQCRQLWSTSVSSRMLCVRSQSQAVCQGNSGNPLVLFSHTGECRLVGIVSSGHADCHGDADIFLSTRIASFLPWIEATLERYPRLCRRQ